VLHQPPPLPSVQHPKKCCTLQQQTCFKIGLGTQGSLQQCYANAQWSYTMNKETHAAHMGAQLALALEGKQQQQQQQANSSSSSSSSSSKVTHVFPNGSSDALARAVAKGTKQAMPLSLHTVSRNSENTAEATAHKQVSQCS